MLQHVDEPISSEVAMAKTMEHNGYRETYEAQNLSYSVTFLDCADQETAQKIAVAVNTVVSEMSGWMPLRRLDNITFADDFIAALRNLDRGFSASGSLIPTEMDEVAGVAMAPLVLRDGFAKICIVMQAWLGNALIGTDTDHQTTAIHVLVNQLAYVTCVELIDQCLPGVLLNRVEDDWDAGLYIYINNAWTAYFAARMSAIFNPTLAKSYRDILVTVLARQRDHSP